MSATFRLAVDATNLARDRRGMGRVARAVVRAALGDPTVELTMLADRGSDARALRAEFPQARVRWPVSAASKRAYDAVWFPFNGMRFGSGPPALVTMHDAFAFTEAHPDRVARYREQAPVRRAARDADAIVTDSHWSRDELARALDIARERIDVIAPMPDSYWFPKLGDTLPAGIAGRPFALIVGVRERRKNARTALEACARAFAGRAEQLVIVGELRASDRDIARRLGLRCGEIAASDALLRALYRNAGAVLVPSFAEGFGLVAVEALACGAPVLAANASALPEATGGAAMLLPPADVPAWATAVRELFDDPAKTSALRANAASRFAFADRTTAASATLTKLRGLVRPC